jgi:hypothetical protein
VGVVYRGIVDERGERAMGWSSWRCGRDRIAESRAGSNLPAMAEPRQLAPVTEQPADAFTVRDVGAVLTQEDFDALPRAQITAMPAPF